ncbi:MAG: DUF2796 domain-containing protein [Gammaproteobacteria bacterium]|nr:DUF2796 domain-containing protein [Gammaproteobacteria bacterium]
MNRTVATALSAALVATSLGLQPAAADERRGHGAHVHGLATLNVAREGHEVHIGLDSPAVNIFGFEHAPTSPAERDAVTQALGRLEAGTALFGFPARAACTLKSHTVDSPLLMAAGHGHTQGHTQGHTEGHPDDSHDRHAHDREPATEDAHHGPEDMHDHHGHDGEPETQETGRDHDRSGNHRDHEDHHTPGTDTHTDVTANYRFHCEHPTRLERMEVRLFEPFPATQRLRVQFITDRGQGAAELTPENRFLSF